MWSRNLFLTPIFILAVLLSACARDTVSSDQIAMKKSPEAPERTDGSNKGSSSSGVSDGFQNNNIRRSYSFIYAEGDGRASFLASFYLADTWTTTVKLAPPSQLVVNRTLVSSKELMSKEGAVTAGVLLH